MDFGRGKWGVTTAHSALLPLLVIGSALAVGGCGEKIEQAKQAAAAASEMAQFAKQAQENSAGIEQAQEKAAAEARKNIPEGMDPELAKQQVEMAKGLAAMQAMGKAGGPVVNWRQLAPMLPDSIGGYGAKGELDGKTSGAGGMETTEVGRRYEKGETSVRVRITDSVMASMLRAPFAMAAMIREDSTKGYKKGKTLAGSTAIVEWDSGSKRSTVTALVAKRFIVNIRVRNAEQPDAAEKVFTALDLKMLAAIKPESDPKAE